VGAGYWEDLTPDQQFLAGALQDEYRPLRSIIEQRNDDAAAKVTAHVR
jgi:hypothetical protein